MWEGRKEGKPMLEIQGQNVFASGLDTWLIATGQVPAPEGDDGVLRSMAVVLLGEEWLDPETVQRLLPIGPWASRDEALMDGPARARLRDMTLAEKSDLRRALFGARKYLARFEGHEIEEKDPREWLFKAALENLIHVLEAKKMDVDVAEDRSVSFAERSEAVSLGQEPETGFRAVVETFHPRRWGPVLRFVVDARSAAIRPPRWSDPRCTMDPSLGGGVISCIPQSGCEQTCPLHSGPVCQKFQVGIGHLGDVDLTKDLGRYDF